MMKQRCLGYPIGFTSFLSRQINRRQTLIEKFESYSKDAACAIVLMTPDDEARATRAPKDVEVQARQNVVFELGYFCGKLNRENVIVLNFGVEHGWPGSGPCLALDRAPLLFLTARAGEDDVISGLAAGADACLTRETALKLCGVEDTAGPAELSIPLATRA